MGKGKRIVTRAELFVYEIVLPLCGRRLIVTSPVRPDAFVTTVTGGGVSDGIPFISIFGGIMDGLRVSHLERHERRWYAVWEDSAAAPRMPVDLDLQIPHFDVEEPSS